MLRKMMISLMVAAFLLVGCATAPLDYSKPETHAKILEKGDLPQMVYPAEIQPFIDDLATQGLEHIGTAVDRNGDFCMWFKKADGTCVAVIILVTRGGMMHGMECADALKMYEELCVKEGVCGENPYAKNKV